MSMASARTFLTRTGSSTKGVPRSKTDTIKLRLPETNLLVEDVHRRRSVNCHVNVTWQNGRFLQYFVTEDAPFHLCRGLPGAVDIELGEHGNQILEVACHIV